MSKENTAVTKKKMKRCKEDVVFDTACFIILTLVLFVVAYPLYWVIISSISAPSAVSSGKVLLHPIGFTMKGYAEVFKNDQVMRGFLNSLIITFCGVMVNLIVTLPTSYALSRSNFSGKKPITIFYLITMFFSGGLIPTYMVVKSLGLTDTMTVMVLPFSVVTYYIIVGRTFFENSIPDELWEAAQLDGCGYISFFFKICLPLSKAIIAVIALWAAVGQWNGYFNALIYLRSEALQPLQIVLRNILISNQTISSMMTGSAAVEAKQMADLIKYAVIVVSSAPIMCMYPFVQKYFNQGVMLGAVKG